MPHTWEPTRIQSHTNLVHASPWDEFNSYLTLCTHGLNNARFMAVELRNRKASFITSIKYSIFKLDKSHWQRGTWRRSRSKHCATSRKVAGSIPDVVTGIFHWHNPSSRTMALELTQPLTEMSTRNIFWGVKAAGAWGWQPYQPSRADCFEIWEPHPTGNPQGLSRPVMRLIDFYTDRTYRWSTT